MSRTHEMTAAVSKAFSATVAEHEPVSRDEAHALSRVLLLLSMAMSIRAQFGPMSPEKAVQLWEGLVANSVKAANVMDRSARDYINDSMASD